jgi:ATP-dependent protease HslVU (ClpYQ) peptidase subunit
MTAIAAISHDGKVYIGGDSAGSSGHSLTVRKDPKVFINGKFVMGFTSSFRMGSILRYSFQPPCQPEEMIDDVYMNTLFIDAIREALKSGGYASNTNGEESGGTFIVGYRGVLYVIDSDFQVGIPSANYDAVGCGSDLCLGSLFSTDGTRKTAHERIEIALKAAEMFSGGVRGPFVIESI